MNSLLSGVASGFLFIGAYLVVNNYFDKSRKNEVKETYEEIKNRNRPKLPEQFIRKDGTYNYKEYFLQSKNNIDIEKHYTFIDDEAIQCKEVICKIARFGEYGNHIDTREKTVRRYVIEYISKYEYNIEFYKYLIGLHPCYIHGIHSNLFADREFICEIEEDIINLDGWPDDSKRFYIERLEKLVNENKNNKGE